LDTFGEIARSDYRPRLALISPNGRGLQPHSSLPLAGLSALLRDISELGLCEMSVEKFHFSPATSHNPRPFCEILFALIFFFLNSPFFNFKKTPPEVRRHGGYSVTIWVNK
jgi:hypothetical protein